MLSGRFLEEMTNSDTYMQRLPVEEFKATEGMRESMAKMRRLLLCPLCHQVCLVIAELELVA